MGLSTRAVRTRLAQNKQNIPHTIAVLTMTMLLVSWANAPSKNECPASEYALRHACAPRLKISSAMLTAIARRTSFNCQRGICKASSNRLTVEAKAENDSENLIGLIQGLTL